MKRILIALVVVGVILGIWMLADRFVGVMYTADPTQARQAYSEAYSLPAEAQASLAGDVLAAFEDPGVVAVEHFANVCGTSDQPGEEQVVMLIGSYTLPRYANAATVFLNGWRARYLNSDHHLRIVRAHIADPQVEAGMLSWQTSGVLSDKNFDDAYEFCYTYTVIAWNDQELDVHVDNFTRAFDESRFAETALFGMRLYSQDTTPDAQKALLPMGFALSWANQSKAFPWACFECAVDHHLLQIAYDLGQRERYLDAAGEFPVLLEDPGLSFDVVDDGYMSWETLGILKDNARRRDFWLEDSIQTLGGTDVGSIAPPFTVLPREDMGWFGGCIGGVGDITEEYEITNVPYEYAIPMLTGWEIAVSCDDEHVRRLGVQIDEFEYDKPADASVGTLRYTLSSLGPSHHSRHRVSVLGLKAAVPQEPQQDAADLEVVSSEFGFCNRSDDGGLAVTIRNNGTADAGPSTTSVRFQVDGSETTSLATAALAPLESIELAFEIPSACFRPDCSFEITADSANVLFEPNEDDNRGADTCIG